MKQQPQSRLRTRVLQTITVAAAAALALSACGTTAETPNADVEQVLMYGINGPVPVLKAGQTQGNVGITTNALLHRGLLSYDADGQIIAGLAESWEVVDPATFTFTLRDGLTFQDGSEITSANVENSLEYYATPESGANAVFQQIDSIETDGDLGVTISLTDNNSSFLSYLALADTAIVPDAALSPDAENTIGAGPFQWSEQEEGVSTTLTKFDGYYGADDVALEEIDLVYYTDGAARVNALTSTALPSMTQSVLATAKIPLISTRDQRSIVDYLDRETAGIDAFIADQEQLIALLAERRAATIIHAVTKGLDPTAPMKDSGIEWLGGIPASWGASPLKRRSRLKTGTTPKLLDEERGDAAGYGWYRPEDLDESGAESRPSRWISDDQARDLRSFDGGSSLVCGIGATLGKVGYVARAAYCNQQITAIEPNRDEPRYAFYALTAARQEIVRLSVGNTLPIINNDRLGALRLPLPPLAEQRKIAEFLDDQVGMFDEAIADAREAIALSRERRAALISAAVTGKIDVRGAA